MPAVTSNHADTTKTKRKQLPRLGVEVLTAGWKHIEVELPDAAASVLLRKPTVGAMLALQALNEQQETATAEQMFEFGVKLIHGMLVEPEVSEAEFRALVDQMTFGDFQHLQDQAMEIAGMGETARQRTEAEFPQAG